MKIHPVFTRLHPKTHWRELLAVLMILLATIHKAPHSAQFLQHLKQVSDEWLAFFNSNYLLH